MFPEAGPSRTGPSSLPFKPAASVEPPRGPARRDGYDSRDRQGFNRDPSGRPGYPPRRDYPSSFRPRSRSPSPPRRYDRSYDPRDARSRDRPDDGWRVAASRMSAPSREWPERERDDSRYRSDRSFNSFVPERSRSPPFAPRGPRSLASLPPAPNSRVPPIPRALSSSLPTGANGDRRLDPTGPSGNSIPREPRSMRGSSSPVDTKRPKESPLGQSASLPPQSPAGDDTRTQGDLEEGEVVSPVKSTVPIDSWTRRDEDRSRREWPRDREYDRRYYEQDRWESRSYRYSQDPASPRRRSRSPSWRSRRDDWEERDRLARSTSTPLDRKPDVDEGRRRVSDKAQTPSSFDRQPERASSPAPEAPTEKEDVKSPAIHEKEVVREAPETPAEAASATAQEQEPKAASQEAPEPAVEPELVESTTQSVKTVEPAAETAATAQGVEDVRMRSPSPVEPAEPEKVEPAEIQMEVEPKVEPVEEPKDEGKAVDKGSPAEAAASAPGPATETTVAPTAESSVDSIPPPEETPKVVQEEITETVVEEEPALEAQPAVTILPTIQEDAALQTAQEPAVKPPSPVKPIEEMAIEPAAVTPPSEPTVNVTTTEETIETPATTTKSSSRALRIDTPPRAPKVTIAERRSVVLPQTNGTMTQRARLPRRDSQPTGDSAQNSTDAETDFGPRTADAEAADGSSETEGEDTSLTKLIGAVKAAQRKPVVLDVDVVVKPNRDSAPEESTRVDPTLTSISKRDAKIEEIVWPLVQSQDIVAGLVATTIKREQIEVEDKVERLKAEYLELEAEWKEHCEFLDQLMEKRGPPPGELYAAPAAFPAFPVTTPGVAPVPSTPVEESFGTRNRRRGGGDAANTEAEFEAILASLADTAARDPNARAKKTTAVVPDMLLDHERNQVYDDDNDLVLDPIAFYDFNGDAEPVWTDEERATFQRRYLNYPKQFGKIAETIANKSASDCVLYYYRTKRTVDYKGMLASRRGDKKKKAPPIKKGGKSSALLADLSKAKPTVNPATTPGPRSAITPARAREEKKARNRDSAASTPTAEFPPRRRKLDDDETGDSIAGPSRAGSETPSVAKLRMTAKTPKRPRVSSINDIPGMAAVAAENAAPLGPGSTPLATVTANNEELLPPVKRSGKRRKVVDPADPNAPSEEGKTDKDPSKPRRTATNSYWSVDEKRLIQDLVRKYGSNAKAIAAEIPGKSERQVINFIEAHRNDMHLDDLARLAEVVVRQQSQQGQPGQHGQGYGNGQGPLAPIGEEAKPAGYPQPTSYGRSIYDVFPHKRSEAFEQKFSEPRMAMFPPGPPGPSIHHQSQPPNPSPPQPISRAGGMRISALLNDDTDSKMSAPRVETDATSDGTISERDAGGPSPRPSSRGVYDPAADLASMRRAYESPRLASSTPRPPSVNGTREEWRPSEYSHTTLPPIMPLQHASDGKAPDTR